MSKDYTCTVPITGILCRYWLPCRHIQTKLPLSLPPLLLQEIIIVGLFNTDRAFLLSLLLSPRHIFVEIHIVGKTTRILGSQIEQLFSHTKSQDQTIFHSQILKLKVQ